VAAFRFSRRAESDLMEIAQYTLNRCCQQLADNPDLGRACDDIRPGLRRMEHGRHVVFYRQNADGVLISRILHQRMLPERHAIDDQEDDPYRQ
jgi:toxin ParE1/3/4